MEKKRYWIDTMDDKAEEAFNEALEDARIDEEEDD